MQKDGGKRNGVASSSVRNIENKNLLCFNGYSVIGVMLISLAGLGIGCLVSDFSLPFLGAMGILTVIGSLLPSGFFINGPNEAKVVEFLVSTSARRSVWAYVSLYPSPLSAVFL